MADSNDYNIKSIREQFRKAGVFYTPPELAERMAKYLPDDIDAVYDPACGRGGLFQIFDDRVQKYGQDVDKMAINDCYRIWPDGHFAVGDTLSDPAFKGQKFKAILANPPFNAKWDQPTPIEAMGDERWKDLPALPPKSKADWAFIAHCLNYLADDGTMVILEFPGILYRSGAEQKVRDYFVRKNIIDRIESIPPNTFVDTAIATVLVVFKKNRKPDDPITIVNNDAGTSVQLTLDDLIKADSLTVNNLCPAPEEPQPWDDDPDWANKTNEQVEASELKRIQAALNWALTVRKIDPTIKKPIGDFLDEIEKVVENFKKRLHNESESDIINITDEQSR